MSALSECRGRARRNDAHARFLAKEKAGSPEARAARGLWQESRERETCFSEVSPGCRVSEVERWSRAGA